MKGSFPLAQQEGQGFPFSYLTHTDTEGAESLYMEEKEVETHRVHLHVHIIPDTSYYLGQGLSGDKVCIFIPITNIPLYMSK